MNMYSNDIIDGRETPPLVITSDHVIEGVHSGTVHVERGHLEIDGTIKGTLVLHSGTRATIAGAQKGTVTVHADSHVIVSGRINGTTIVDPGATLIVEGDGKLAGTLRCDGLVVVRGVFAGAHSGSGQLIFEGSGYEKEPVIRNGIHYYEW